MRHKYLVLYLTSCFVLSFLATIASDAGIFGLVIYFVASSLTFLFVPFVHRSILPPSAQRKTAAQYAARRGFTFRRLGSVNRHGFYPTIFQFGWFPKKELIMDGRIDGLDFHMFFYTYRHPLRYTYLRSSIRVIEVSLPKMMPHMYFASLRPIAALSNTDIRFDTEQAVDLGGEAHKKFAFYTHRRTVTDSLAFASPNLLALLVDNFQKYDLEIIGDKLYIYARQPLFDKTSTDDMLEAFGAIAPYVKRFMKNWHFSRTNTRKYPFLRSRHGFGSMKLGSKYFGISLFFIGWYALIANVQIYLLSLPANLKMIQRCIVAVSCVVMICVLLVSRRRYKTSLRPQ